MLAAAPARLTMLNRAAATCRGVSSRGMVRVVPRRWNSTDSAASASQQTPAAAAPGASPPPAGGAGGVKLDRAAIAAQLAAGQAAANERRRAKQRKTLRWVGLFAACTFLFPFGLHAMNTYTGNQHYSGSQPFTPAQRMRGPYLNSSTRDIGPDPNYAKERGFTPVEPRHKRIAQQQQQQQQQQNGQ